MVRRLRNLLCVGAGAVLLPMPAAATPAAATGDVCAAIARLAAASRERPAFRSIRRARAAGQPIVPGFEADDCTVTADGIACQGTRYAPVFRGWPNLVTCRGVVAFEPPTPGPRVHYPSNRYYRLGRFLIGRGVRCPGCAALGPPFFVMEYYRPPDRRR